MMMKAGASTRAISPAPLTLSAATLLSRGGRSGTQGGGEAGTAGPTGINNPHLRLLLLVLLLLLLLLLHGGRRRLSEPYTTYRASLLPGLQSHKPPGEAVRLNSAEHRSHRKLVPVSPPLRCRSGRESFLSINNNQPPLSLLPSTGYRGTETFQTASSKSNKT